MCPHPISNLSGSARIHFANELVSGYEQINARAGQPSLLDRPGPHGAATAAITGTGLSAAASTTASENHEDREAESLDCLGVLHASLNGACFSQ